MADPTVLIVEDDDAIRTLLVAALRREPVSVHTAADGLAALERVAVQKYAVILLDLMMPRVDGFEFLERLNLVRTGASPVIIVMTAFDAAPVRKISPRAVHAIVHKPFDVDRVVEMVRDCALLHAESKDRWSTAGGQEERGPLVTDQRPPTTEH